jgi:outer membrane protein OmpA-like peptidoglycan-associated protein
VADNSTPEGRQANRRVQLEIRPNEKLKARQG